jgi:tetratricopeptide (TPR) repeat protein
MDEDNDLKSEKPELVTYRSVLEKAIRDGKGHITNTKAQILIKLRKSLGITEDEHDKTMEELLKKYEAANLATYRSAIEQAMYDNRFSTDEEKILELLRKSMNISMEEHQRIVNQVKGKMKRDGKSEPLDEPEKETIDQVQDGFEQTATSIEDFGLEQTEQSEQIEEPISEEEDSYYWVRKGEIAWVSSEGNINKALEALQFFDKALEIDPENYLAWANKGLILKTLDKVEEALLCYNRALRINPEYITVWYNKGVLLGSLGNFQEAIRAFNKVLELNPEHEFAKRDKTILKSLMAKEEEG